MFEVKVRKQIAIDEHGTAEVTTGIQFKNKSDHPGSLSGFGLGERTSDVVDIKVRDKKGNPLSHRKSVEEDFVNIRVDLEGITVDANKTYNMKVQYTLPSMIKKFDGTYFYKQFYIHSYELAETCEWAVTYELPKLFDRYEFWKELHVSATQASRIYTYNGQKIIEHKFVLPKGSHREFSFMFQERYNSKIVALLSILAGVVLRQFFEWLVSLIF